ncbi:hypothetical protein AALP_AA8G152100 [Arabis alpina]|uniref:Uncharacterized protein n=1 Tax=Arabis alpina TaxID=50452 RepID=A0A087G777_ARAAL|nr:hypothetical protein AALP_AA8G152100 [Arabis alpina]
MFLIHLAFSSASISGFVFRSYSLETQPTRLSLNPSLPDLVSIFSGSASVPSDFRFESTGSDPFSGKSRRTFSTTDRRRRVSLVLDERLAVPTVGGNKSSIIVATTHLCSQQIHIDASVHASLSGVALFPHPYPPLLCSDDWNTDSPNHNLRSFIPSKIQVASCGLQIWAWPKIFNSVVRLSSNLPRSKICALFYCRFAGSRFSMFMMSNILISSYKEKEFLSPSSLWERSLSLLFPNGKRTVLPFSLSMRGELIPVSKPWKYNSLTNLYSCVTFSTESKDATDFVSTRFKGKGCFSTSQGESKVTKLLQSGFAVNIIPTHPCLASDSLSFNDESIYVLSSNAFKYVYALSSNAFKFVCSNKCILKV